MFFLVVNMEGKIIQLPHGIISKKNDPENELQFNFPPNFGKYILFDKLPYLSQSKNPILNNVIKNGALDNLRGIQYKTSWKNRTIHDKKFPNTVKS